MSSVERRIISLDEQINDYFVKGMELAVAREEKAGYLIPPFDEEKYGAKDSELDIALNAEGPMDEAEYTSEVSNGGKNKVLAEWSQAATTDEGLYSNEEEPKVKAKAMENEMYGAPSVDEGLIMKYVLLVPSLPLLHSLSNQKVFLKSWLGKLFIL